MTRQPIIFAIAVVAAIGFPACADNDADRSAGSDLTPAYDAAPGDAAGDSAGNAMANHADPFKPYTAVVSDEPPIKHDVVSGYFADDPSDREFESLRCVLPDVAGLGGDILFGGGRSLPASTFGFSTTPPARRSTERRSFSATAPRTRAPTRTVTPRCRRRPARRS
ncbi:MAG: hypothetical protein M5R36_09950 [Deltaproteobacteria bacterium]|nr:hypothetical protein [Deltaproteobacteria bacterium]